MNRDELVNGMPVVWFGTLFSMKPVTENAARIHAIHEQTAQILLFDATESDWIMHSVTFSSLRKITQESYRILIDTESRYPSPLLGVI